MSEPKNLIDDYILDESIKKRTLLLILLFGIAMVLSTIYWPEIANTIIGNYTRESYKDIESSIDFFKGPAYILVPIYIYARNLLVVTISTILSFTVIIPFAVVVFNGSIIGFVVRSAMTSESIMQLGNPAPLIAASLLPHGSVEIPAIAIAASSAIYFVDWLRSRRVRFSRIAKRNLLLSSVMLGFSAFVEAFITPIVVMILIIIIKIL